MFLSLKALPKYSDNDYEYYPKSINEVFYTMSKISELLSYRDLMEDMPYFTIPNGVKIKIIPPCSNAVARILLIKGGKKASILYNAFNLLGYPNCKREDGVFVPYFECLTSHDCLRFENTPEGIKDFEEHLAEYYTH